MSPTEKVVEVKLEGHPKLFAYERDLELKSLFGCPLMLTPRDRETFTMPYAHMHTTGEIMRFNEQIGTKEDLSVVTS